MKILILGGDGYLGWPTAMHLSDAEHDIAIVDNYLRHAMAAELGAGSLTPIQSLNERRRAWREVSGRHIEAFIGDLTDPYFTDEVFRAIRPEAVIHYGEQPSAPYSMIDRRRAVATHRNNIEGTLNVLYARHRARGATP